ncbi:hypothetical protein DL98DRAFT_579534 [Cadophora sp. DSE1049]|nr:hypothetical protein DL98DRAFT_579534 [Cadophora sp. DSE1049]
MKKKEDVFKREAGKTLHASPKHNSKLFTMDSDQQDISLTPSSHLRSCDFQVPNYNTVNRPPGPFGGTHPVTGFHSSRGSISQQNSNTNLTRSANDDTYQSDGRSNYGTSRRLNETSNAGRAGNANGYGYGSGYGTGSTVGRQSASGVNSDALESLKMVASSSTTQIIMPHTGMNPQTSQKPSHGYPPSISEQRDISGNSSSLLNFQSIPERNSVLHGQIMLPRCIFMDDLQSGEKITEYIGHYYILKCPACLRVFASGHALFNHVNNAKDSSHYELRSQQANQRFRHVHYIISAYGQLITDATKEAVLVHNQKVASERLEGMLSGFTSLWHFPLRLTSDK